MSETVTVNLPVEREMSWDDSGDYTWNTVPISFTWAENTISECSLVVDSTFNLGDSFSKVTTNNRVFTETIPLTVTYNKTLQRTFIENLQLTSSFVQGSSSIIYDVSLRSAGDIDITSLRTLARQTQVAGYEAGVEFLPGDYDFEEAIIGLVLTNNTGSKIGFKEIDMYTDTPDIIDRGTIEITNTGPNYDPNDGYTTVFLNKQYHFVPNVTAVVVSGNDLAEPIFDPDGFTNISFRVKVVLSSGGSSVTGTKVVLGGTSTTQTTGTLMWKASGY